MLNKMKLMMRVGWFIISNKYANSLKDYDKVSNDYDYFFSNIMGRHSLELLNKIDIRPGQHVLELACGTGFITAEIARRLHGRGTITAVDQSFGMLDIARRKLSEFDELKVNIHQNDMMNFLRSIPSSSVDIVVCGWAICYTDPVALFREVRRVLKPNGQVGIIETRIDSEEILMRAFEKVINDDPSFLRRYIKLKLPNDAGVLRKWFSKGKLKPIECWEGEQILPCRNAKEAMDWILRSGAAAGFLDMIDREREEEILNRIEEQINIFIEEANTFKLSHTYVAGVALKDI